MEFSLLVLLFKDCACDVKSKTFFPVSYKHFIILYLYLSSWCSVSYFSIYTVWGLGWSILCLCFFFSLAHECLIAQHHLLKGYSFSIELLLHLCEKSFGHICIDLSVLFFPFCSIDLSVSPSPNTTQSWLP